MSHTLQVKEWTVFFNSDLSGDVQFREGTESIFIPGEVIKQLMGYQLSLASDDIAEAIIATMKRR